MATDKELSDLLGRAMLDSDLRQKLLADPLGTCRGLGLSLTDEQLAGLKNLDLNNLSEGLDDRISKRTLPGAIPH
jgi:hypothetical protein